MYLTHVLSGGPVWIDGDQEAMDCLKNADRMIYNVERILGDLSALGPCQQEELKEMLEAARYYLEQADKAIYGEKTAQEFDEALKAETADS